MRERVPFIVVASVLAVGTIAFVSPSPSDPRSRETPAAGEAAAALPPRRVGRVTTTMPFDYIADAGGRGNSRHPSKPGANATVLFL